MTRQGGALEFATSRGGMAAASADRAAGPEHSLNASPVTALALGDGPLLPLLAAECGCVHSVTAVQARPADTLLCCALNRPHAHSRLLCCFNYFEASVQQPLSQAPLQVVLMAGFANLCDVPQKVQRMVVWQCRRFRCPAVHGRGRRGRPPGAQGVRGRHVGRSRSQRGLRAATLLLAEPYYRACEQQLPWAHLLCAARVRVPGDA